MTNVINFKLKTPEALPELLHYKCACGSDHWHLQNDKSIQCTECEVSVAISFLFPSQ